MNKNKLFSARNLAVIGILTALSYILYLLPKFLPIFKLPFFPPWLDVQISDLPAMLGGFALGPIASVIIIAVKCLLKLPFTGSSGIGELADLLIGIAFVLPSSFIYRANKSRKSAILGMVIGTLSATFTGVLSNRFILIPFYAWFYGKGDSAAGMNMLVELVSKLYKGVTAESFYTYYLSLAVVPFNLLRCVLSSVITYIIYKPLSKFLHWDKNRSSGLIITKNAKQTMEVAKKYAKGLTGGDVVLLQGEMGVGKTVFAKGVAKGLGIDGEITSPTYAYMNDYDGKLYHYDCYRLSSGEDAEALGLTDYFYGNGVCLIEWSDNIKDVLPKNCKVVRIEKTGENERKITL